MIQPFIPEPNFVNVALTCFAILGGAMGFALYAITVVSQPFDKTNKLMGVVGAVIVAVCFITYHLVWGWY